MPALVPTTLTRIYSVPLLVKEDKQGPTGQKLELYRILSYDIVGRWGSRAEPCGSARLCSTPRAYRRRALLPAASGGSSRGAPTGPLYSTVMILMTEAEPMRWRAMTFWPFVQ